MLTSALVVAILAVPGAIELYFNSPNEPQSEEYIPDGR
jgi:hypothetical protein